MLDSDLSIVIVDDTKFSTTIIKKNLTNAGFANILSADSAFKALEIIHDQSIDLVIADWMMPEMDGIELTERIRQFDESNNSYTYVIMMTAKDGVDVLRHAFEKGIDDFVNKSSMQEQLVPRVLAGQRVIDAHQRLRKDLNTLLEEKRLLEQNNAKLKNQSTLDSLTGLGNKNYCITKLMDHLKHADSRGGAACFILLRFSNPEELEDKYPPKILSELILGISRRLKSTVRPLDDLARIDKYSFGVITQQANIDDCVGKNFNRIRDALNKKSFETSMGFQDVRLEMSISGASMETGLPKADVMIKLAMQAMRDSLQTQQIEHLHYSAQVV